LSSLLLALSESAVVVVACSLIGPLAWIATGRRHILDYDLLESTSSSDRSIFVLMKSDRVAR